MLAGRLTFVEGDVTHDLGPGDSLELGEPADCTFRNDGTAACRYLVVVLRNEAHIPKSGYRFSEKDHAQQRIAMNDLPNRNHNQGPPLDDEEGPEWGDGDIYVYYQLEERAPRRVETEVARPGAVPSREGRGARPDLRGIHARDPGARALSVEHRRRAHRAIKDKRDL